MEQLWKRAARAPGDDGFGPNSPVYADFTLLFEDAIFTVGPSAVLLALAPFYIWHYMHSPIVTTKEALIFLKMGVNSVLVVLHVAAAVLYNPQDALTATSVTSSVMMCLAAIILAILMHFEHRHAPEPSPLPAIYLFVTMLLDITKARSYFLRSRFGLYPVGCIVAAIATTKLVLLILGEMPKRYRSKRDALGTETTSGFWSRTFFVWVNSTLLSGFRNILSIDDLPNMDASFASAKLSAIFEPIWKKHDSSSLSLIKATFQAQLWPFLAVVPARLLHMGFTFAEPLLLQEILRQVGKDVRSPEITQGLIGAMALVHSGLPLSRVWYKHMNNQVVTKTRGMLVAQILRKSLSLDPHEAKRTAASTLMSTDVDGIANGIPMLHETWASVVELVLSIYLLSTVVAESAFLTMLPAIFAAAVSIQIGKSIAPAVQKWNKSIETRVSMTSHVLSQLRGIKMIAAETAIGNYIQSLRHTEVENSKGVRKLSTWRTVALTTSYASTPIIVIAGALFWRGFDGGLNAVNVFAALAFIYLSARPMASILHSWSRIGGIVACFSRIQAYLLLPEHIDCREQVSGCDEKKTTYDLEHYPVQFINACISSPDDRALLMADAVFESATTTMVIGATGVGKSTLLRAVLGEADLTSGSILVQTRQIAYCGQEEWIRNVTIRDNIIGMLPYDEKWYNTVTTACLLRDLDEFAHGHLTLAGNRGSNLSGGQRQRVELARAVYKRAKVVVLDGVLSALDRSAAVAILRQLLGSGGVLRNLGSTVIMSTHSVELLKSADKVLVVHANGTVSMQSPDDAIKEYEGKGFLDAYPDASDGKGDKNSQEGTVAIHNAPPEPKKRPDTQLRQVGDMTLYNITHADGERTWYLTLEALRWTKLTLPDIYIRLWVEKDPDNKILFIGYAVLGLSTIFINILWSWLYFMSLVPESAETLHQTLITSVTSATLSFLTYTDSGSLLNRFSQDMSLVVQDLPLNFFYFTYYTFGLLVTVAVIASAVQYAALVIPALLVILYGIQLYYLRTSRQLRLLDIEAKGPLYSHLTECSEGLYHIRAFQWEQEYLRKGLEVLDRSQKPFYYRFCIQRWLGLVLDLVVSAAGVTLVALALNINSSTQAAVGLGLLKVMQVAPDLTAVVEKWVDLETSLGAVSRTRTFERDTPQEETVAGGCPNLPEHWPNRGEIQLQDVSADHVIDGENHRALHDLSVEIAAGSKVGIVGRTGSGKSSFLLTLLNFLKFSGTITIDEIDITTVPRRILRSRITTISQEFVGLPGSIRDNLVPNEITMAKEDRQDDASLVMALTKVGLYEVIERAGGLDTKLEDAGLSAGQQQLFALARAILHHQQAKTKIVLVDEATSCIDYESEEKLKTVVEEEFGDCTVLTIAHRNQALRSATNVLELSSGRLVSYK